jgi:serine/threonine-protein kinase
LADVIDRLSTALTGLYTVDREIGRGGMATVFLAHDIKHDRAVALKVLKPEIAGALGPERFLREITLTARLDHPHILPVLDSGEADGLLYYVMPFVEGESLSDRLAREKQLPVDDALQIAREVADALSYAHGFGIVHRDIKPENILLAAGHARVADFGIARAVSTAGGAKLTETGFAIGTPEYMSPEQAGGEGDVDGRSDTYSLGCVIYHMLAGAPPFTGPSAQSVMARHAVDPAPRIATVRTTTPAGVETAVMTALAKVPADRFATISAFGEALKEGQTTAPSAAAAARPATRRRVWISAAAAIAVVAAGSWGAWSALSVNDSGIRSLAVLPFKNISGDAEQEYFVTGMHDALTGELAQISALRVVSRTSTMRYGNSDKSVPEIARELNVDGIVEGSVSKTGDSVRLQIRLIAAFPEERQRWTHAYDYDVRNVLGLYGEVVRAIAQEAEVTPTPAEAGRLGNQRALDREAQDAYLRGKYLLARGTPDGLERGLEYLHRAVDIDPTDPRPWSALALAYVTIGHSGRGAPDAFLRAKAAARNALELDDTEVNAYVALGDVYMFEDWDWEAARQAFERALELNPNDPNLRFYYGFYHELFNRRDQALAELELAKALDPFSPRNISQLGWMYYRYGRYQEAIDESESALQLAPDLWVSLLTLGSTALAQSRDDDALTYHRRLAETSPYYRGLLGPTLAATGHGDEARQLAAELEQQPTELDLLALAYTYAQLGDHEEAFKWLERAFESPHSIVPWLGSYSELEPLHDDPRFQDLMERLELPMPGRPRRDRA